MRRAGAALLLLAALPLAARIYPQFGVESFLGGRYKLFSLAPWGGARFPLGSTSSLILKLRQQSIAFDEEGEDEVMSRRKSSLTMLTGVYYYQSGGVDAYAALFQMAGSGGYSSTGLDAGVARRLFRGVGAEAGLYLINEKSNLWYPDETARRITTYVWHVGLRLALPARLELQPQLHFGSNSESVRVLAWSAGLNFSPLDPVYVSLTYMRYSENDRYRFSGDYFWGGINFYF